MSDAGTSGWRRYSSSATELPQDKHWKARFSGRSELPRARFVRSIMLNHWYHHRGQLLVYLRLLDVPVPSVYGPTADENPFAAVAAGATQ